MPTSSPPSAYLMTCSAAPPAHQLIFEQIEYISAHLHDYLPGLSSVLSFASLSVRPGLYSLFEDHIVRLPTSVLRPVLKSLTLALLPAIEEETSEDFERAYAIVDSLERKFSRLESREDATDKPWVGYFWQCLFLCVITSPSRRQGALNYLVRQMPSFASAKVGAEDVSVGGLSPEAEAATSPEPGLLIRCFVAGLRDSQALIQRGFLDLLVTHLSLHSPVLQDKAEQGDLDQLVSAAISVLLRKDMSLNKRLWTWFLGPETNSGSYKDKAARSTSQPDKDASETSQLRYFESYGQAPLERCLLAMFSVKPSTPSQLARPFRICLSLMDRWEIGGSLIPRIFLPALQSIHRYSSIAPVQAVSEVLRSASLFFDGVEANLIWATLIDLLRRAADGGEPAHDSLQLFEWLLLNFNMTDEEMLTIHMPLAALYLVSLLNAWLLPSADDSNLDIALRTAVKLLDMLPRRAFESQETTLPLKSTAETPNDDMWTGIDEFYRSPQQANLRSHMPFGGPTLALLLLGRATGMTLNALRNSSSDSFCLCITMCTTILSRVPDNIVSGAMPLFDDIAAFFTSAGSRGEAMPYPTTASTISLIAILKTRGALPKHDIHRLEPALMQQLWYHLAPSTPKYHVEAVRSIWLLDGLVAPNDAIKVSLLAFMRDPFSAMRPVPASDTETIVVRRFTVLWTHTVPSQSFGSKSVKYNRSRRGSAIPGVSDATHAARHIDILSKPLLLVLDLLQGPSGGPADVVRSWLSSLSSLGQVYMILLQRICTSLNDHQSILPDADDRVRHANQQIEELAYYVGLLRSVLELSSDWSWECLTALDTSDLSEGDAGGLVLVARICMRLLSPSNPSSAQLDQGIFALVSKMVTSPVAAELCALDLDSCLIDRLIAGLSGVGDTLQSQLLQLIPRAIKLRLTSETVEQPNERQSRASLSLRRPSTMITKLNGSNTSLASAPQPPPRLLQCIRLGFTSPSARFHLEQWLTFLADVLPTFASAIFASLIPLVDCLCTEITKAFDELVAMASIESTQTPNAPDLAILGLLEALELILARAHDSLLYDNIPNTPSKPPQQPQSFLGNMTSGVFRAEGPPSKTAQANSRLTVILAFQDAIRACLDIWTWSSHSTDVGAFDESSAATTAHIALRLRNKTRYLLEQMFSVEPLESLEAVMARWRSAQHARDANAALSLLQVMQGSRPKNVLPAVLDALCSRANPSALPSIRQSSQAVELAAVDTVLFLLAYLRSTEDDAMDEIWPDCIAFLRDVLANPMPYRMVLSPLLALVHLLAHKVGNTNFGEQRKMRRELGDIFQRLLAATFATLPSGILAEINGTHSQKEDTSTANSIFDTGATDLVAVLKSAVSDMEIILETTERIAVAVNTITNSLVGPVLHAKSFPSNVSLDVLMLLVEIEKKAPGAKPWKKDVADVFNDARLLASSVPVVEAGWLPVLHQWTLRDKDRMGELLSRLTPPSNAGIMFGVGASAARLEADRRTQLTLRRVCLLLLASPEDTWAGHLRDFDEKLAELFAATHSSSPSSAIKADLFMLCMALVLTLSPVQLSPLWPSINDNLQAALTNLQLNNANEQGITNIGLLQACRLLDQLIALSPDEFQLHEWLYIADTVDAVYQPQDYTPIALSDQLAEALRPDGPNDEQTMLSGLATASGTNGQRRLLLGNDLSVDKSDLKALSREEFARSVLRPFLSQLSIHAYEGVYSMDSPDVDLCRRRLLDDVLDLSTIVE